MLIVTLLKGSDLERSIIGIDQYINIIYIN